MYHNRGEANAPLSVFCAPQSTKSPTLQGLTGMGVCDRGIHFK